jgi:hypothetical protein
MELGTSDEGEPAEAHTNTRALAIPRSIIGLTPILYLTNSEVKTLVGIMQVRLSVSETIMKCITRY